MSDPIAADPSRPAESLIREKVRALPGTPGVYLFKDAQGRVVYIGDLFMGPALRTTNRQLLRTLLMLHHCTIRLKWQPFDWLYAFLRDRDVSRGAPWLYHFPRVYPMAHSWTLRPSVQTGEHWLAAMDRREFVDVLAAYLAAPHRL